MDGSSILLAKPEAIRLGVEPLVPTLTQFVCHDPPPTTIALGTDSGTDEGRWQGYFEQVELEMMAKAGMTPMQVIVAATGAAAQVSKLDHVGTIAAGKAADLLVLDGNPLQNIGSLRQIHSVWIAGRRMGTTGTN